MAGPVWEWRSSGEQRLRWAASIVAASGFGWAGTYVSRHTTWAFVADAGVQLRDLTSRLFPPDGPYLSALAEPLVDTLHIATLGTALGIALALPLAFFAAHTTTPAPRALRPVALFLLVTSRSVNSLIWALILVVFVGPGVLAGVLAIALRSVGFVGKLVYEAIEEAPRLPVTALHTTGASRAQALAFGLLPHVLPTMAGVSVYRWEINIREATILGIVGAGGLGMALQASIDALAWSRVSVVLGVILSTVVLAEWISAKARRALR